MLSTEQKEKVKALLGEAIELLSTRQEVDKTLNTLLKKDEQYQELLMKKKEIDNAIFDYKEDKYGELISEKDRLNESLAMIKEDITDNLEIKKKITNKLISFYKMKYEKNEDELDMITMAWAEVFEGGE